MTPFLQLMVVVVCGILYFIIVSDRIKKNKDEIVRPIEGPFGFVEPWSVLFLVWLSKRTLNQAYRADRKLHGLWVDRYVLAMWGAAYVGAGLGLGQHLWVFAIWRICCLLIQILGSGIYLRQVREGRGDEMPASDSRIVALGLINWTELVALYALIYQAARGQGLWLYESFTTQVTMSHSTPIHNWEKLAVVSQISMSLLAVTTLISMFTGTLGPNRTAKPPVGTTNDGAES